MTSPDVQLFRRVYVWEIPVRVFHWVNALAIVVLVVTGFVIGNPIKIEYAAEAHQQQWFGTVRAVHFAAAFFFVFNFLFRVYWSFVGNRYANWREWVPTRVAQFRQITDVIKKDILLLGSWRKVEMGHNALGGLTYFALFLLFLFQCATGFALYADMSRFFLPKLFGWVVPLMGGDMAVRQWHHAAMWLFIAFSIIHIYLVFYHDSTEENGTISSMAGGWKFNYADPEGEAGEEEP